MLSIRTHLNIHPHRGPAVPFDQNQFYQHYSIHYSGQDPSYSFGNNNYPHALSGGHQRGKTIISPHSHSTRSMNSKLASQHSPSNQGMDIRAKYYSSTQIPTASSFGDSALPMPDSALAGLPYVSQNFYRSPFGGIEPEYTSSSFEDRPQDQTLSIFRFVSPILSTASGGESDQLSRQRTSPRTQTPNPFFDHNLKIP